MRQYIINTMIFAVMGAFLAHVGILVTNWQFWIFMALLTICVINNDLN